MKNFKRVISAVIALAISASTLVAVSASKFPDVDDTNSYAGAINLLAALDVVSGYEDGTFNPDGDITRAEAARMIVSGLNMNADAQAAAGTSKFTDVNEKASWATGFVNVGVAQGYINGMDDKTFAPQENVTYAQLCVMLTTIAGYKEYAEAYGGWPTGYTTIAASTGINKGVSLAADAKLKRGQVAQMLYNAMVTPMLGVEKYSLQGNEYAVQDGDDLAFKTVLSSKFDGYEVEMTITATPKSSTVDKGKADITLKEDSYLDEVKVSKQTVLGAANTVYTVYDEFGVEDFLHMSGKGVMIKDSNKDWHLVYFEASENDKIIVSADDYTKVSNGGKDVVTDSKITFGSKDYAVNASTEVYVNGELYLSGASFTNANVQTVLAAAQGKVSLIDDNNTTKGYEKIMVNAYNVAKVLASTYTNKTTTISVSTKAGLAKTITDTVNTAANITTIKIEDTKVEEDDIDVTVKNKDGEAIELSSIKKDDIIAFAIAPSSTASTVTNPKTLDIVVTDETVSGVVTKIDTTEGNIAIDGTEYTTTNWGYVTGGANPITVGTTYKVSIDPFGRIFDKEVEATSAKFAIAEKYDTDYGVQLILPNGKAEYYELDTAVVGDAANITGVATGTPKTITLTQFENYIEKDLSIAASDAQEGRKSSPEERIVEYVVKNSTGKITEINLVGEVEVVGMEYKARTEKLGTKSIIDTTAVIDASDYTGNVSDYSTFAVGSFVDSTKYDGVIKTAVGASGTAAFVVLTKVGETLTPDSRFAVVRKTAVQTQTEDGDNCYSVNVLYEGKEQDLLFTKNPSLNPGDAFFFMTDNEGLVTDYLKVLSLTKTGANPTYNATFTNFGTTGSKLGANGKAFTFDSTKWDYTIANTSNLDYQLVYAIVTDVDNKGIEMVQSPTARKIDLNNDTEFFGVDPECVAYRYGINEYDGGSNQYKAIGAAGATASIIDQYEDGTGNAIYDLSLIDNKGESHLTYALALIVDGDIVQIYTIVQ